jgi:uncharacterized membrane protein required for colicin V production
MDGMTIWILAIGLMTALALAGWRQGAIRSAFAFVGILFGVLLAVPLGRLFHPLLPHLGASNPIMAWALAPLCGFIVVQIAFTVAAFSVHRKVEHFYKYNAGDLRLSLWERTNGRLGLCLGLLNGAAYFVLACFVIFNLTYLTTQVTVSPRQPALIRFVNQLGNDVQATGMARTASAVGAPPEIYFKVADLSGLLMQNPQVAPRVADYPGLTSVWERDDMQALVQDPSITNALASGASLGDIINTPSVQDFIKNPVLIKLFEGIIRTNLDDLTTYLQTGKSPIYDGEKILGQWQINIGVTIAWLRQDRPRILASEMRAIRALWSQAYAPTVFLLTGDHQLFIKNLPRFQSQPGQPPFTSENWKGDWSLDGTNYTLHVTFNGEDKFMTAALQGVRLQVKDGSNLLILDGAD